MPNTTKPALEASLKKLMLHKPLDKITINDLATDCGISRMSFYYHFRDIYDLIEWVCVEDGRRALQDKKTYDTWQEGQTEALHPERLPLRQQGQNRELSVQAHL